MSRTDKILIVVDPGADRQPAVERGMLLAERLDMAVDLFICDYNASLVGSSFLNKKRLKAAKAGYINGKKKMLEELARSYRDRGIDVTVKVAWDRPLHEGIIRQALHSDARFVVKDTHYHTVLAKTLFSNTDWHLIQHCPSPLWLVRDGTDFDRGARVMVAVDPLHEHDKPGELDARLISEAFEICDAFEGEVHIVHVFNPYIAPQDPDRIQAQRSEALTGLAERLQVPTERTHLHSGNPVEMLPRCASDIGAGLVVMGAIARSRLEHAVVGSTAEKVLDQMACDVLVVKPKGFISQVTFKSVPDGAVFAD